MKINEIIAKEDANGILPSRSMDDDEELEDIDGIEDENPNAEWEYWAGGLSPG